MPTFERTCFTCQTCGTEYSNASIKPYGNLDTAGLAERLGVTVSAITTRRSKGGDLPPSFKVGRNIRYRLEDVERWEREQVEKETARRAASLTTTNYAAALKHPA